MIALLECKWSCAHPPLSHHPAAPPVPFLPRLPLFSLLSPHSHRGLYRRAASPSPILYSQHEDRELAFLCPWPIVRARASPFAVLSATSGKKERRGHPSSPRISDPPSWSHCVSLPEMYSSCQSDAPLPGLTPLNRFSPCRTGFVRVSPIAASMARRELSFSYRILSCNPAMLHKLWPRTTSAAGNVSKLALDTQLIRLPLSTSIDRR